LALVALGLSIARYPTWISAGALHGLKVLSVAVVAQALWTMAFGLWHTRRLVAIGVAATLVAWILPGTYGQIAVILLAAVCGIGLVKPDTACAANAMELPINSAIGTRWLTALGVVFLFLFAMDTLGGPKLLTIFWAFFRTGALVFGGGHVVLPVLHAAVVAPGWVEDSVFTAGYGAAQAVPGPLFTFAAFLGAVIVAPLGGWLCAILCLLAIFAPSFFLVFGTLPHWVRLRQNRHAQSALMAVNAATVGILAAAFQHYVWRSAVNSIADLALTCIALLAITVARLPVWAVASTCALLGIALQHFA
jgi:chromate transporter